MILDDEDDIKYVVSREDYLDNLKFESGEYTILPGPLLTDIGNTIIVVNIKAGIIPHFEIHSKYNKFKTCLELCNPKYYFREREYFYKLTSKQIDELITFLEQDTGKEVTNHLSIYISWDYLNNGKIYKYNKICNTRDYNLLKGE